MCILIYNWTADQSNQSWAALLQCNCCNTTNKKRRRRRRRPMLCSSWSWRYFQAQVQGGRERRSATDMNMQWGLISDLVLPWRMALSPAWCCLNMNFITTHLSWLVMGSVLYFPPAHTPFPIMMREIFPFIITLAFCIDFLALPGSVQTGQHANERRVTLKSWRTKTWLFIPSSPQSRNWEKSWTKLLKAFLNVGAVTAGAFWCCRFLKS